MDGVLAVDLGKTGCRAVFWAVAGRSDAAGPGAAGLATPGGVAAAEAAILAVARPLLRGGVAARVGVGAAGALSAPEAARTLARRLRTSLPAGAVAVASDAVTSHAGALAGRPGVVLAVGTGVVALAVGPGGVVARVDGHGPWLGDEGSGAWLGLRGLRAALQAADGRGPETALLAAAIARFGPLEGLAAAVGGDANPARQAARFASDVVQAAAASDAVARALLAAGLRALVVTARAAVARSGVAEPVPLALTGGMLRAWPDLPRLVWDTLGAAVVAAPAAGTAVDGARLIAVEDSSLYEALVQRS